MFIPRVYSPHSLKTGATLSLNKEESHYLMTVLRLKNEAPLFVFNGEGGEFKASLQLKDKKACLFIGEFQPDKATSPLKLHLGQSILRGDKMDWVIEKATELGITEITPLISKRGLVKITKERFSSRLEHWQKIAISATEQCGRTILPIIHPPLSLEAFARQPFDGASLFFQMQGHTLKNSPKNTAYRFVLGPESGFDTAEIDCLKAAHFVQTDLGSRILRAETASIVATSLLQGFFGDMC
jgi:16S rRNA (uracil1498-N3)-methyltransferase